MSEQTEQTKGWLPGSRLVQSLVGGVLVVGVGILGWCLMSQWSNNAGAQPRPDPSQKTDFAIDREPVQLVPAKFDGDRAMSYLKRICALGPRISGSEAMKNQQKLLENHFKKFDCKITWQNFEARQISVNRKMPMTNMVVSWHPERKRRVVFCSHYDTRPMADQEPNRNKWKETFLGANDGGSGTAVLMELAHHMKDLEYTVGVDFVFFDGEEWVFDTNDTYFFGSLYFAKEARKRRDVQYVCAILLDMVAGKNAKFPIEQNSWFRVPQLVQQVWGIAGPLGATAFRSDRMSRVPVEDDHMALNRGGIPAIDIIDFDYPHWHRLTDTPANCSAEPMTQVGAVLSVWLQKFR